LPQRSPMFVCFRNGIHRCGTPRPPTFCPRASSRPAGATAIRPSDFQSDGLR
jgi:hypothetical protein